MDWLTRLMVDTPQPKKEAAPVTEETVSPQPTAAAAKPIEIAATAVAVSEPVAARQASRKRGSIA